MLSAVGSAQSKAGVLSAVGSVTMPEVDVVCAGPPLAAGWRGATAVLHQRGAPTAPRGAQASAPAEEGAAAGTQATQSAQDGG